MNLLELFVDEPLRIAEVDFPDRFAPPTPQIGLHGLPAFQGGMNSLFQSGLDLFDPSKVDEKVFSFRPQYRTAMS